MVVSTMQPLKRTLSLLLVGDAERRDEIKRGLAESEITLAGEIFQSAALRLVPRLEPDVVVLDLAAREINSLVALQWLSALPKVPEIIAVGVAGSPAEEQLVKEMGAHAYARLDKPESIKGALQAVLRLKAQTSRSWLGTAA
jgi:chemotaxis response regulator CheB